MLGSTLKITLPLICINYVTVEGAHARRAIYVGQIAMLSQLSLFIRCLIVLVFALELALLLSFVPNFLPTSAVGIVLAGSAEH